MPVFPRNRLYLYTYTYLLTAVQVYLATHFSILQRNTELLSGITLKDMVDILHYILHAAHLLL